MADNEKQLTVVEKAKKAVAKAKKPGTMLGLKAKDITDIIVTYRSAIAQAIPKHLTPDRIIQQATTLISRTPALAECTVESLLGATMQASILGFQPVAALGQCYFVPFNNKNTGKREVQFIIGYKGYIDLARRSKEVKVIMGYPVYENDEFKFELGLHPVLKHVPSTGPKGKLTHAYAVAHFINGGYAFEVCTRDEIMKRKDVSQSAGSKYSPWTNWEAEMWVKTAIKKLSKWLPLSVEVQERLATDEGIIRMEAFKADGELNPDEVEFQEVDISDGPYPEPDGKPQAETTQLNHTLEDLVDEACRVYECSQTQAVERLNALVNDTYKNKTVIDDLTEKQIETLMTKLEKIPF